MIDRFSNVNPKREEAQGLVELIVALTVLAIGIGSLLTLLTSSALSLQRSDQKGTALVLAEKQIELLSKSADGTLTSEPFENENETQPTQPQNGSGQGNA